MSRSVRRHTPPSKASAYPGNVLPDMRAWMRSHPWQADGLLVAVLFAFSAGQWPRSSPPPWWPPP
jgi:hypothetical protein